MEQYEREAEPITADVPYAPPYEKVPSKGSLSNGFTPQEAYGVLVANIENRDNARVQEALSYAKAVFFDMDVLFRPKMHLVCEYSDSKTFGIVRDTEGRLDWKPGEGAAVGEWTTVPTDNMTRLFITSPLEAIHDKAIARMRDMLIRTKERNEHMLADKAATGRQKRVPKQSSRTPNSPKHTTKQAPEQVQDPADQVSTETKKAGGLLDRLKNL